MWSTQGRNGIDLGVGHEEEGLHTENNFFGKDSRAGSFRGN